MKARAKKVTAIEWNPVAVKILQKNLALNNVEDRCHVIYGDNRDVSMIMLSPFTIALREVSKYGVIYGPYFVIFGLNTDIYGVNLRIPSEYRKIRTRNNSVFKYFSRSSIYPNLNICFFKNLILNKNMFSKMKLAASNIFERISLDIFLKHITLMFNSYRNQSIAVQIN